MAQPADVLALVEQANAQLAQAPAVSPKMQEAMRSGARLARDSRKSLDVLAGADKVKRGLSLAIRAARRSPAVEVSLQRPRSGRERRPSCNKRTRGSRRTSSRAGPGGDDPGESDLAGAKRGAR